MHGRQPLRERPIPDGAPVEGNQNLSNHTLHTEKRGIRGRRVVLFGVSLPVIPVVLTVLGAGVALAAVLLTTNVGGKLTIKNVGTSNSIKVTGSADNGSALDCSKIDFATNGTQITLSPVLTKTINGGNATSTDPVPGGDCTINLSVQEHGHEEHQGRPRADSVRRAEGY
jgi:hypothetical protein